MWSVIIGSKWPPNWESPCQLGKRGANGGRCPPEGTIETIQWRPVSARVAIISGWRFGGYQCWLVSDPVIIPVINNLPVNSWCSDNWLNWQSPGIEFWRFYNLPGWLDYHRDRWSVFKHWQQLFSKPGK